MSAILGTAFDITERKRAEEALREAASHDHLTGLLNRRAGFAAIQERLDIASRLGRPMAILALDLDHFKRINDTFGHDKGDLALRHFASVITELLGGRGLVCRLGGDEFEIALDGASEKDAVEFAARLLDSLRWSLEAFPEEHMPRFTASIGIGCYPDNAQTLETLRQCADDAMYAAKAAGGGGHTSWTAVSARAA